MIAAAHLAMIGDQHAAAEGGTSSGSRRSSGHGSGRAPVAQGETPRASATGLTAPRHRLDAVEGRGVLAGAGTATESARSEDGGAPWR